MIIDGYAVEDERGIIYYVVGTRQPEEAVYGYPKFIASPDGSRIRNGVTYRKMASIREAIWYAAMTGLDVVNVGSTRAVLIPRSNITRVYDPVKRLRLIIEKGGDDVERAAAELAILLARRAEMDISDFGVTGSILVELHTEDSDIDLTFYGGVRKGVEAALKVYKAALRLRHEGITKPVSGFSFERMLKDRWSGKSRSMASFIEQRKVLQGLFSGRPYGVKLLKKFPEVRGTGFQVKLKGVIEDSSRSMLFPAEYLVRSGASLYKVISFRTRFCEQAEAGEEVKVEGLMEPDASTIIITYEFGSIIPVR